MQNNRSLSFWQIWNMSFGFLGIQFGWGLQMANMSSIYEYLGADAHQLPLLWLAAPLTGLIVQPIIGHMSDRTWGRLGRRRPYFLVGAILSSLALFVMPHVPALWMAAGLLWILDASINISMEPFRALVADLLPEQQRTTGFVMQSLLIGLGSIVASALPFLLKSVGVSSEVVQGQIPRTVTLSFAIGAAAFLLAVLWTIVRTRENPPKDMEAFLRAKQESRGLAAGAKEVFKALGAMPSTMRQFAWVQIFTWLGLFSMWMYFGVAVARNVFGATSEKSELYGDGIAWAGVCFAAYSAVCFVFSFFLPTLVRWVGSRKVAHALCLAAGAVGLASVGFIHDKYLLLFSMVGVGIAWTSITSLPYAVVASSLPEGKTGVYMGIFNFFIVIPEIFAALAFGPVMEHVFNNNRVAAVVAGGAFMFVAALLSLRVVEPVAQVHSLPNSEDIAKTRAA
jgi:maltose/moltooligosaccharide transporter